MEVFSREIVLQKCCLTELEKWRPNVYAVIQRLLHSVKRHRSVLASVWARPRFSAIFGGFSAIFGVYLLHKLMRSSSVQFASLGFVFPSFLSPAKLRFASTFGNYPRTIITVPVIAHHRWLNRSPQRATFVGVWVRLYFIILINEEIAAKSNGRGGKY